MDIKSGKKDVELPLLSQPSQDFSLKPASRPSVDIEKPAPKPTYFDVSALSLVFFAWVTKIVRMGNIKVFQQDHHYNLRNTEDSAWISDKLSKEWEGAKNERHPLLKAQYRTFKALVWKSQILGLTQTCLDFTGPVLVSKIIAYVATTDSSLSEGLSLVLAFVVSRLGVILISSQNMLTVTMLQNKVIAGTRSLIFRKFLKFPLMRDQEYSAGTIMNHMLVDVENTAKIFFHLPNLVQFPFIVTLGIVMMYTAVGLAFIGGVFSVLGISFIVSWVSKILFRFQKAVMEAKDDRIKKATEVLTGIKYIKMCGLETKFIDSISTSRENELFWLLKRQTTIAYRIFSIYLIPILLAISVFGCYILFGNELTSQKAFLVLSTIVIIQHPLNFFGQILNDVLQGQVSLERVQKFMFSQEINTSYINYRKDTSNSTAIKISNGNFKWIDNNNKDAKDDDKPRESAKGGSDLILKDINMEIKKGAFVAILGDVGSGKSSLFNCLMGEMLHDPSNPPSISISGSIAYVAQKPWIFNATIKDNILFNNELNENDYQEALRTSSLKADLRTLIKQDQTEIGEKGVNLSGGQKARVALARAIYADNDIYLLDDPLSAVDAHVGKYILEECLSKRLKDKTRVLVTHKIESLRYVDYIYIFKAGQVVTEGPFEEIKKTSYYQEIEEQANKEAKNQEGGEDQSVGSRGSISEGRGVSAHNPSDRNSKGVSAHQKRGESSFHEGEDQKELLGKLMLDEDRKTGAIGIDAWLSYFRYLGDKKFLFWQIVTLTIWIVLKVGADFWLANWSNVSGEETEHGNGYYYTIYAAFGIISATSLFIQTLAILVNGVGLSRKLHVNMFKRVIRAPLNLFFDRVPLGRLVNRFASDLDMVDSTMNGFMTAISHFPLNLLSRFVVCSIVGTMWVFPLSFVFLILGVKIQRRYLAVYREAFRLSRITSSPITGMFAESLDGLTQIRSSNSQGRFLTKYASRQNENIKNQILVAGLQGWFQFYINVASLVIVGPTITLAIIFSRGDVNSAGLVGLLVTYLLDLSNVMIATLQMTANFEAQLIAFERCKAFANVEAEKDPTTKLPVTNYSYSWPENGQIEFKNYYAKYRPNLPYVVKDVSFTIQGSEKIGVVGRTGSGKSTLLLCLLRIIESNLGKIYIDGVDISEVGLDDLRRKITIIPQDPLLYKGTVRSNLDLFGQYSDHEMWNVLEKVCLKNKFQQLGLESEIKEGGENLSAGEKQLLCIARAILSKNKIILIDEATSSIDNVTEETILQSIHDNFRDCTMITIAHRLKTIISSDKVLFMSGGQVAEFDSPQTLLKNKNGHFYKLWKEYEDAKA